jgi:predicted nucleotidyltransferase
MSTSISHESFETPGRSSRQRRAKNIRIPREKIANFCLRNHIRKLSLFGSVLRDDFGPESDVDVLVEFEPEYRVGLIRLSSMEIELSQILGRKVDLRTPADLSRYFRQEVVESAEVQFVAE